MSAWVAGQKPRVRSLPAAPLVCVGTCRPPGLYACVLLPSLFQSSMPTPLLSTPSPPLTGTIVYGGTRYRAISKFALVVLRERNPQRQSCDGWKEVGGLLTTSGVRQGWGCRAGCCKLWLLPM